MRRNKAGGSWRGRSLASIQFQVPPRIEWRLHMSKLATEIQIQQAPLAMKTRKN
jgi:hypothetical protein